MAIPVNTAAQRANGRLYESNFRHFGRGFARHAGGVVLCDRDVEIYSTPFQCVFNAYLPPRWPERQCETKLVSALTLAKEVGRLFEVIAGPSTNADALRPVLLNYGLRCGYWIPFMHRDLAMPIARTPKLRGIRFAVVDDFSLFDANPHPYIGPMTTVARRAEWAYHQMLCRSGRARLVAAFEGGTPVATVLMYSYRGTAGIYDVGVLESHRGNGIGHAIMLASLREARNMGSRCALLSAVSRAVPLYRRIGFTDAGHYGSYYIGSGNLRKCTLEPAGPGRRHT